MGQQPATARVDVPFSPPGRATQLKEQASGRLGATKKLYRGYLFRS